LTPVGTQIKAFLVILPLMFKHVSTLQTIDSQCIAVFSGVWFFLTCLAKQLIYNVLTKFLFGLFGVFPNKQTKPLL
jgi:hypothetical protein